MPRLFTALEIPRERRDVPVLPARAACLPPADRALRTTTSRLRFIGDIEAPRRRDRRALDRVSRAPFPVTLRGLGAFGGKKPHSVHADVEPSRPLDLLQGEIDRILQRLGVPADPAASRPT